MENLYYRHRCLHFRTEGFIVYDPDRKSMSKNVEHWAIIQVDDEISRYYRYQFFKRFGIELLKPSWESHISVLKGYNDTDRTLPWGWRDGEIIEVNYGHELFWNEYHVWINAYSSAIDKMREHYGIFNARDNEHITIGKFNTKDIGLLKTFGTYRDLSIQ